MLDDSVLIRHEIEDRKDITIYPVSDVHLGCIGHKSAEWKSFCDRIYKEENSYVLLGGDLIDNPTRNSIANVYEAAMRPRDAKNLMCEQLEPIKDKILAAVPGNHEMRKDNRNADNDIMYDIMCKLDIEDLYRENMAFINVTFRTSQNQEGYKHPSYILCLTHGAGGGMLTGGAVNRAERFGYVLDGVDILCLGHTHKPYTTQPTKLKVDSRNGRILTVPFKVVSMTSWLGYGGYAMREMYNPSSFCPQTIKLFHDQKRVEVTM